MTKKLKLSLIIGLAIILLVSLALGLGLGLGLKNSPNHNDSGDNSNNNTVAGALSTDYIQPTKMPYYAEWLDKDYPRQTNVVVKNEGLAEYPKFGTVFKTTGAQARSDVYNEIKKLTSGFTSFYGGTASPAGWPFYNMMDKDGNLLKIDINTASGPESAVDSGMDLYKHTAAAGMYFGDVSADEPAVVKKFTLNGKIYGTIVTGLYAPAGEVVKVEMPASSLRDRNLFISIGQTFGSGTACVIPAGTSKKFVRMPIISNRFRMNTKTSYYNAETDTYTCYVGSHLGGPIYLLPNTKDVKSDTSEFEITISGAVNYSHFILGVTTQEEFEYVSKSTAPYFDMEVSWIHGVRHSGPLKYASMYNYEQLKNVAELWEKFGLISNQFPNWCETGGNIVFAYDDYVPNGSAVAICGHRTVDAPYEWLTNALNYEYFVTNGSWGNLHEYNHHYQKFGLSGDSNEISNNALNLLEYALFTKISSQRTLDGGLGGWNAYTMPQFGLQYLVTANNNADNNQTARAKMSSLHVYATILHNIGPQAFIDSGKSGSNPAGYYRNLCNGTHLDMTYFFTQILNYSVGDIGGEDAVATVKEKNYPVFVPVNTVYQVGRVWEKDGVKQYGRTAQPFVYGTGDYVLDFENYLVIPDGFSYKIKSVTQPENGSVTLTDGKHIAFKPNSEKTSGEFFVTLQVTKDDGAFEVEDVEIIINLEQDNILQRTTWSFTEETLPQVSSVDDLMRIYEGLNATDKNAKTESNINPAQNSNTEIWGSFSTDPYSICELKGSLYINSTGKYRIALRGRRYAALYLSYDGGKTYTDVIKLTYHDKGIDFMPNDYVDVELKNGDWVDFKAVLLNDYSGAYIGVGIGKFGADTDGESVGETVNINFASAYRNKDHLSELYIAPPYASPNYTYTYNSSYSQGQTIVDSKYSYSVNDNPMYDNIVKGVDYSLENVFDDDETNCFWSTGNTFGENSYSEENPFEVTVDMGKTVTANVFTIYYPTDFNDTYYALAFKIYAGETMDGMKLVYETEEGTISKKVAKIILEKPINVRFYKLVISKSSRSDNHFALRKLEWSYTVTGSVIATNSTAVDHYEYDVVEARDAIIYEGDWESTSARCTFGMIKVGGTDSSAEFEFEGNQIAIFSYFGEKYGTFDVYIDGEKVDTCDISEGSGVGLAYISKLLGDGKHTLLIKGNTGAFNIDSFALFK